MIRDADLASPPVLQKVQSAPAKTGIPPSKTDKPRPHICVTCTRSFARLEHLKRHERSHTKEKPFECEQCTRCFARRDLLLRHQQKLHLTAAPTAGKNGKGRRESIASSGTNPAAKIRKNSTASTANGPANARPRANTISHIDGAKLGVLNNMSNPPPHQDLKGLEYAHYLQMNRGFGSFNSRGMHGGHGNMRDLPRLATQTVPENGEPTLRTAPPVQGMDGSFAFSPAQLGGPTVNPAQLHMGDVVDANGFPMDIMMEDDESFDWLRGYNSQMNFNGQHNQAINSSPSLMSHASMTDMSVSNGDMNGSHMNAVMWQNGLQRMPSGQSQYSMDGGFNNMNGTVPMQMEDMHQHGYQPQSNAESYYPSPPHVHSLSPQGASHAFSMPPQVNGSDGMSVTSSTLSGSGSARHSSVTSVSTESITEVTRHALLMSLSQPSVFGHGSRKYSQPAVSSPLRDASKAAAPTATLPSTADLQRYVNAYIQYFHPHFPFLHIPTLSFDTPAYTNNIRSAMSPGANYGSGASIVGGGGCLVLAMAAIGALYEHERPASKELFDAAKKMIQLYLEERRKVDVAGKPSPGEQSSNNTPLWLVQAMLLNVIYGHNCGDKISGDIASTHCSALVSLARAAQLLTPLPEGSAGSQAYHNGHRLSPVQEQRSREGVAFNDPFGMGSPVGDENAQWHSWAVVEERKRTLYAIFHMSSLLVSAYNHAPALMNSEVQLDLPCEEDLWCAETSSIWMAKGGSQGAQQRAIPFSTALSILLTASQAQGHQPKLSPQKPFGSGIPMAELPPSSLKPSTFGCLTLINALHNYIWETRQRHSGREWTTQETESMHAHIEPALRAWQAAWASNPTHSLERPNPYGAGPLSADCIPLLDLAYVRLFVNLGSSKEAFWQRDFDAMTEELAQGAEIIQHADHSETATEVNNTANASRNSPDRSGPTNDGNGPFAHQMGGFHSRLSKRERHLRKAAFYAADSLSMSNKLGVSFADFTGRELPLQAGLCTMDCAQILAEWVATVQERVGPYLGVLGRDPIDLRNVPAIMLLEDEDCKLLDKLADILNKTEAKTNYERNAMADENAMNGMQRLPSLSNQGYASKVLILTAYMFDRAAVWPGERRHCSRHRF